MDREQLFDQVNTLVNMSSVAQVRERTDRAFTLLAPFLPPPGPLLTPSRPPPDPILAAGPLLTPS
eukprot:3094103-Pyramimonas_sp.AAC.1